MYTFITMTCIGAARANCADLAAQIIHEVKASRVVNIPNRHDESVLGYASRTTVRRDYEEY